MTSKIFVFFLLAAVLTVFSCRNPPPVTIPCNPAALLPFADIDTLPTDSSAIVFYKDHLAKWYAEIKYTAFNGKQAALVRNINGLCGFYINHFNSPKLICRHLTPQNNNDRFYRHIDGRYGYYDDSARKVYMVSNPFDSILSFTDTLPIESRVDKKATYFQNEMQAVFYEDGGKAHFIWNYGLTRKKNINYLDDHIFLHMQNGQEQKIGAYPKKYNKAYRDKREAFYAVDSNHCIYYALAYSDSVYKMDLTGRYKAAAAIAPCRSFDEYAETDLTDLAYKRRYMMGSEQNMGLELVNGQYIVMLRRKSSMATGGSPAYIITVYNKNLEKLYHHDFPAAIIPIIYHYQNAVFFVQQDFKEIYEFKIN